MVTKQQIYNIKINSTRVIEGLLTEPQEFTFDTTGGFVKPETRYSIYYTDDMREIYMTGLFSNKKSKIIKRTKNQTLFKQYLNVAQPIRTPYPTPYVLKPKQSDYERGDVKRYFVQKANDTTQPVFEINKEASEEKNSLYNYTTINWLISGLKSDVDRINSITIRNQERNYPGISKVLFPLQYWKPSEGSKEDLENKLKRLKK